MSLHIPNLQESLRTLLTGRVCIVGVGNRGRSDDGAGPRLIDLRRPGNRGFWIDAGVAPENHLEPIAQTHPDTILIVDAVDFGARPGHCRLMDPKATDMLVLSTHAGSLNMLAEYLTTRTSAKLNVLGIQPGTIEPGETLSDPVAESVTEVAAVLADLLAEP